MANKVIVECDSCGNTCVVNSNGKETVNFCPFCGDEFNDAVDYDDELVDDEELDV